MREGLTQEAREFLEQFRSTRHYAERSTALTLVLEKPIALPVQGEMADAVPPDDHAFRASRCGPIIRREIVSEKAGRPGPVADNGVLQVWLIVDASGDEYRIVASENTIRQLYPDYREWKKRERLKVGSGRPAKKIRRLDPDELTPAEVNEIRAMQAWVDHA